MEKSTPLFTSRCYISQNDGSLGQNYLLNLYDYFFDISKLTTISEKKIDIEDTLIASNLVAVAVFKLERLYISKILGKCKINYDG